MSKPSSNPYLKLSSAAIQMALIIGGFTFLGNYLDNKWHYGQIMTIIFAFIGIGIGLYIVIKEVKQLNDEN